MSHKKELVYLISKSMSPQELVYTMILKMDIEVVVKKTVGEGTNDIVAHQQNCCKLMLKLFVFPWLHLVLQGIFYPLVRLGAKTPAQKISALGSISTSCCQGSFLRLGYLTPLSRMLLQAVMSGILFLMAHWQCFQASFCMPGRLVLCLGMLSGIWKQHLPRQQAERCFDCWTKSGMILSCSSADLVMLDCAAQSSWL